MTYGNVWKGKIIAVFLSLTMCRFETCNDVDNLLPRANSVNLQTVEKNVPSPKGR